MEQDEIKVIVLDFIRDQKREVSFDEIVDYCIPLSKFAVEMTVKWALEDLVKLEFLNQSPENLYSTIIENEIIRLSKVPFFRGFSDSEFLFLKSNKNEVVKQIEQSIAEYNTYKESSPTWAYHNDVLKNLAEQLGNQNK